jgi:hypothetical protein
MEGFLAELIVLEGFRAGAQREAFAGTNDHNAPRFWQIEQLQAMTLPRSVVTSKRTSPQWQPPV